ncbi:DUF3265 domain-containing protein [Vibrio parahaemolyticus]|nr:DUF3265 domain-containing protein [Vibrio parahaemolyticus]
MPKQSYFGACLGINPNKLFKSDSQRVAFLLCVMFGVYGGMRELQHCVAHTLTGR